MRKYRMVLLIIAVAALALIGFFVWRGRVASDAPGTVMTLDPEDLPDDFLENLESVKPEIDGFHFDEEEGSGSSAEK